MVLPVPAAPLDAVPKSELDRVRALLGSSEPLRIVAIAYTALEPMMAEEGRGKLKCIPFLSKLCLAAALGHSVVVFEGHATAFGAGVADCDVLLLDSGMLPFLTADWMSIAQRVMGAGAKYFICARDQQVMQPVVPSSQTPGWMYVEPNGEASYANCLLTALAKQPPRKVEVAVGEPLPDISALAAEGDVEWAQALPFQYADLDSGQVIRLILQFARCRRTFFFGLANQISLQARLAGRDGSSYCSFDLVVSGFGSPKKLSIVRNEF